MSGPLAGIKVVELQGRGPGPFGAMVLADLGAEVIRVGRLQDVGAAEGATPEERLLRGNRPNDLLARGRRSVAIDLKHPEGVAALLRLVERADVLIEGNRPGVVERLGVGPDICCKRNERLVYARITGWGQEGPYAATPGHDLNYVALAGALDPLRRSPAEAPMPPLNLLGDFGGGGMLLVVGILAALVERAASGRGQVVDAAMVDGVALLSTLFHGLRADGVWSDTPGTNVLDLAAPHYNVYETADGKYVTFAAGEPQFYAELVRRLGLDELPVAQQMHAASWPEGRQRIAEVIKTKTRDEWCALLEGTDTCFAPVLTMAEAPSHPHHRARHTFVEHAGVVQPAPAPRFDRTPAALGRPPARAGEHSREVLADWGFSAAEIDALVAAAVVGQAQTPS